MAPEILFKYGHNRNVDWYLVGMLTYELLVGSPPFYSSNRKELFENIKYAPLEIPKHISPAARSFIQGCLQRNPGKRLGAIHDAKELKNHEWFKEIDWGKVYRKEMKPPYFKEPHYEIGSPLKIRFKEDEKLEKILYDRYKFKDWTIVNEEEMNFP